MRDPGLIPFWIEPPGKDGPRGFGVTAFSLADALRIIEDAGYSLPQDKNSLHIKEGVKVSDLDQSHIVPNMGPIVVRGIWYPFTKVGL